METANLGSGIGKLGFGLMRLPMIGNKVDIEQSKVMVDHFMEKGFTYFDTAFGYLEGQSEKAAKEILVSRYPRESFQLVTKLPIWMVDEPAGMQKVFDTQRERTGVEYFDFYLLHSLSSEKLDKLDKFGAWDFMKELKAKGLAKHIGFSFHDTAKLLDRLLTEHPEMEFVQLQINYADWDNSIVQSRECYEVARKHGKSVTIMEPVKGGSLAALPEEIEAIFKKADPAASIPSWAIRFAASLDGVITVLSGMSSIEQMDDNLSYMTDFKPLTEEERTVIGSVVEELKKVPSVPCTSCRYCMEECPQGIVIPLIFSAFNNYNLLHNFALTKRNYDWETRDGGTANKCIQCGACEAICPQHIKVIDKLKEASAVFDVSMNP
ncbi:aldo/keto reductase [Anaerolentibacter hominis]|uniref:aldo/keto reductase n=1 Tax=Anaerolentibacter hominis TaxID=3079009 RepID=UPI0031B86C54